MILNIAWMSTWTDAQYDYRTYRGMLGGTKDWIRTMIVASTKVRKRISVELHAINHLITRVSTLQYMQKLFSAFAHVDMRHNVSIDIHVSHKAYFLLAERDSNLFLSPFPQKYRIIKVWFFGHFLCTPSEGSCNMLFMQSCWDIQ